MELISLVVRCNSKGKYSDIDQLRTEVIKEDLEKYFYDADFMAKLFCVFDTILFAPVIDAGGFRDANAHIGEIFTDLRRIGAESANGVALMSSLGSSKDLFVIKAPKNPVNDELFHELFVGVAATNNLRKLLPNYAYIFGGFKCLPPSIAEDKKVTAWCERSMNHEKYVNYVIYEKVPGKSLADHCATCSFPEFFSWFLQIVLAVQIGNEKVDFSHYDLHDENVMLRKWSEENNPSGMVSIPYKVKNGATWWIKSSHVAVMIDFGMSHVKVQGQHFGPIGFETYGIFPDQSRPFFDIYKLIMFCLDKMRLSNRQCFELAAPLADILLNGESSMPLAEIEKLVEKEYDDYYSLSHERLQLEDDYTLWDYLTELQNLYSDFWNDAVQLEPFDNAEVLTCDGMCPTPGQFEQEIAVDPMNNVEWSMKTVKENPHSIDSKISMSKLPEHIRKLRTEMSSDAQKLNEQLEILDSQSLHGIPNVMSDAQFIEFVNDFVEPNIDFSAHYQVYLNKVNLLKEYYAKKGAKEDLSEFDLIGIKKWNAKYKQVFAKLNKLIVPAEDQEMQRNVIRLME